METRHRYETDVSDEEWKHLQPLVPACKLGGRPPKYSRREILNGIFYVVRSGNVWKLLPHDLPHWRTVYHYFRLWRCTGVWQRIHDALGERVRQAAGRNVKPSAAIVDSQSVRTTEQGGIRGYDAGKKICGRKRHVLVDTLGLVLLVVVTAANVQDRQGARTLLAPLAKPFRRLRLVWADGAYAANSSRGSEGCESGANSAWISYADPKGRRASRFFLGAGWLNAPLPGSAAIDGSSVITSDYPRPRKCSSM